MFLKIISVSFKNFLSFGNKFTTINFNDGLNLVTGENGTGKSTALLDALSFCLFNKPYRKKITLEDLVNRTNKKNTEVSCKFEKDGNNYEIIRGLKPAKLVIKKNEEEYKLLSSKKLNQDEIESLIGINYKLFKQIISLSINYNEPFLSLSTPEKREISEDLFDIKILAKILKQTKEELKDLKIEKSLIENSIYHLNQNVTLEKNRIDELILTKNSFEDNKQKDIGDINSKIVILKLELNQTKIKGNDTEKKLKELNKIDISDLNYQQNNIKSHIMTLENEIYKNNQFLISEQQRIDDLILSEQKFEVNKQKEISEFTNKISLLKENLLELKDNIIAIEIILKTLKKQEVSVFNEQRDNINKVLNEIEFIIKNDKNDIEFLKNNEICPTCKNNITAEYKKEKLEALIENVNFQELITIEKTKELTDVNFKIKEILRDNEQYIKTKSEYEKLKENFVRLNKEKKENETKLVDIQNKKFDINIKELQNKFDNKSVELKKFELNNNITISGLKEDIEKISTEIKSAENSNEEYLKVKIEFDNLKKSFLTLSENITENETKLEEINAREFNINIDEIKKEFEKKKFELKQTENNLIDIESNIKLNDKICDILSDEGIKSFIYEQLIPILNYNINEYLKLFEIPIVIEFDKYMEAQIKDLRTYTEDVSYYSFSEGEKKRIDMSILLSFISVTKSISNWNCNLLIIDELLDSSIDEKGLDKLLLSLETMIQNITNFGIYIISHRLRKEYFDQFNTLIEIKKSENFSEIKYLKG
jgi:DNA repair exonuclease SbcCD ATPase subunit